MKALFGALWVGDRFNAYGNLWTRLDHRTARQHSRESIKLDERGGGYIIDTICSFARDEEVEFVPPAPGVAPAGEAEALDLLAKLFDAYENGADVYEDDPDECAGHMGHAVKLDDATFRACADLLNRLRPRGANLPDGGQRG